MFFYLKTKREFKFNAEKSLSLTMSMATTTNSTLQQHLFIEYEKQ